MNTLDFLRQFRIAGYAVFDLSLTFLGMALLASPLSKLFAHFGILIPKRNWLYLALPIGILVHLIVGTYTPMTRQFLDLKGSYFLKFVILVLCVLGLTGIKRKL
jgi:predicted membrane channel-forming protein YqfA (hemolysin III family)